MAPLKFEDNIKQELEKRVLTPSDSAWDKLETKLKTTNKSNKNQKWWFMGLAASLVGIFLVTSLVFQEKGEIEFPNNQVVDIEQEQQVDEQICLICCSALKVFSLHCFCYHQKIVVLLNALLHLTELKKEVPYW